LYDAFLVHNLAFKDQKVHFQRLFCLGKIENLISEISDKTKKKSLRKDQFGYFLTKKCNFFWKDR
jgi:hypothetical protein